MSTNIIAGYTGAPHVTAQQARFENQGSYGTGTYVLPVGNQLALTITSATSVALDTGVFSMQGCTGENSSSLPLAVPQCATGMKRTDYVLARYHKNNDGTEQIGFLTVQGTAVSSSPTPPSYTTGSIEGGDTTVEYPIWKINVNGLSIDSVERVAPVLNTQAELMSALAGITPLFSGKATFYTFASGAEVNTARAAMSTGDAFMFYGKNSFSQDVLNLATQLSAFGMGFKNSTTSVALLVVCGGNLYYTIYYNTGAGTVYNPLSLTTNI